MRSWCPGMTSSGLGCSRQRSPRWMQPRCGRWSWRTASWRSSWETFPTSSLLSDYLSKDMRVKGEPMNIKFKDEAEFTPFKVSRCRQVPLHMKDNADALLTDLEEKGCSDGSTAMRRQRTSFAAILSPSLGVEGCYW